MSEFDPSKRGVIHDKLSDKNMDWQPEWAEHYRIHAVAEGHGVVGWDGLMLDGWTPAS
jgi:hypothetical protein